MMGVCDSLFDIFSTSAGFHVKINTSVLQKLAKCFTIFKGAGCVRVGCGGMWVGVCGVCGGVLLLLVLNQR